MSPYLVLARKYRPKTFAEVIGQEVVTSVLSGALSEGRIGQAYLFSGPRGTGKTTLARIFAKCLNCERGPTSEPCGACERCRASDAGQEGDILEIDAASHTGVEDVRLLRDEASYAPMRARRKVYIIDEVHMLSKPAFNALLKTLEEPPPHVVFLFATTEPHKVLDTVLSRCQVLRLSALSEERIVGRLNEVFRMEGVRPGAGVAEELARGAKGGMRDALSLADKLLALAGDEPTIADLRRLSGDVSGAEVEELALHLERGERVAVLEFVGRFEGRAAEIAQALLDHLRRSLLAAFCGEGHPLLPIGELGLAARERAKRVEPARVELWMQQLLRARERMKAFPGEERLVLEVTLMDLARDSASQPLDALVTRLEALEGRLGGSVPSSTGTPSARTPSSPSRAPPAAEAVELAPDARCTAEVARSTAPGAAITAQGATIEAEWRACLSDLKNTHPALAGLLERVARAEARGAARVVVHVGRIGAAERKLVADRRNQQACSRAWSNATKRATELEFEVPGEDSGPTGSQAARLARNPAPSQDEFTREVADLFGGVIEELS